MYIHVVTKYFFSVLFSPLETRGEGSKFEAWQDGR